MRHTVLEFYRDVFTGKVEDWPPFLSVFHPTFMHPVVTPNFVTVARLRPGEISLNLDLYRRRGRDGHHWINVLGRAPDFLEKLGYRRTLSGYYLFFGASGGKTPAGVRIERLEPRDEARHRLGTCANTVGMTPEILSRVEEVLGDTRGSLRRTVARNDSGDLIGSVTTLSGDRQTLMVLGWVQQSHRRRGVMTALRDHVVQHNPDHEVFGWTFNPILFGQGKDQIELHVFESGED